MRSPAVQLHYQPLRSPKKIDYEAINPHIHFRLGKVVTAKHSQEPGLELAAGVVGFPPIADWKAKEFRLAERRGEDPAGKRAPHILQSACRLCDLNAEAAGA